MAAVGLVGAVHAVAVDRPGADTRQIAVPDLVGVFGKLHARGLAGPGIVEKAQLDLGRVRRKQCEIYPLAVPGSTERVRQTFPDPNFGFCGGHLSPCAS